jgi:putative DNA primase/helicase
MSTYTLNTYTIEQLEAAFLGNTKTRTRAAGTAARPSPFPRQANGNRRSGTVSNVISLGPRPDHIDDDALHLNEAAHAGIHDFADLSPERKNAMLAAMLALPAIQAIADVKRNEGWLDILFASADAEHLGATQARALALTWSKTSRRFIDEADFDRDWRSFDPARPNGITVGTLLKLASDAGFDLGTWLHANSSDATTAQSPSARMAHWAPPNQRPIVEIHAGEYHLAVDAGLAAMAAADVPYYEQNTRLAEVCRIPHKLPTGTTIMTPAVRAVPAASLTRALTQCVDWRKWTGKKLRIKTEPPKEIVAQILHMTGQWPFPPLRGISATPLMRTDGSLLTEPGYDPTTGLVLFDPPVLPPIPRAPSHSDALAALQLLDDLLTEFPFVSDNGVSHAAALCLLLTAVQRGMMPVAPMFVIVKPQPGTGGSYLVDIAAAIALGDVPPVIAWSTSEEENDKRLIAMALTQKPIIAIDNVSGRLHSDFLCQLAERPRLSCRPLGHSNQIEVSNSALVVANGNNLEISTDEVRRTVQILLDANVEHPEERTFSKNPVALVLADRGKYVAAVLTVARAYHLAGRPGCLPPRASYETWSNTVRSALVWLGQPDPDLSLSHIRAQDTRASQRAAVFSAWTQELVLGKGYRTQELVEAANETTGGGAAMRPKLRHPALREALLEIASLKGHPSTIDPRELGKWLHRQSNTVVGNNKLTSDLSDKARPRFVVT